MATTANTGERTMSAGTASATSRTGFHHRRGAGTSVCLTVAAIVLLVRRRGSHRPTRDFDDLIEGNRRGTATAQRLDPRLELGGVTLVLCAGAQAPRRRGPPVPEAAPVVDRYGSTVEEAFDPLLGVGPGAGCYIMNGGNRTFPEDERESRDVAYRSAIAGASDGRAERNDGRAGERAGEIDEVTRFADDATAALLRVVGPVIARDRAG